jgi:L-lysine exporter family protein LysE/ArgO
MASVKLDTVVLLGTVAHHHPSQLAFGAGAATASVLWFATLGLGAHRLGPLLARPAAWRIVDAVIATAMTAFAVSLAVG